ncbi:DUF4269 domain-containing protein [Gottfriedia acidiceleris]|uniref:DUF4269 domain-containing protein n=1 Tax=Gottfriedia acidiceleris TaxID=371036 RepID=UPI002FFDE781
MYLSIDYLKNGSLKQQHAYGTLSRLNILNELKDFNPVLCGTIPIGIDIEGSDLDIITEVHDLNSFKKLLKNSYEKQKQFRISQSLVRGIPTITANFTYEEFEIEIFGQPVPSIKQKAYLHLIIEQFILKQNPAIKDEIIKLKKEGYKTEPAFCKMLGLEGDPYDELIKYGIRIGAILV